MWSELTWHAWATLSVVVFMLIGLVREVARPDMIFLSALGALLGLGILSPLDAFAGFSNSAVITVGSLFIVAAGVQNTGALNFLDRVLFPTRGGMVTVMSRLMVTTALLSAFLNNTPIVAMLIPQVQNWSERRGVAASKLLIPLSYAAIVGGMTTLIGTSTNLLVSGLMQASGYEGLGLFELTWVGLPAAVCAVLYFVLIGHRFLPDRQQTDPTNLTSELNHYMFEMQITRSSPLVGSTIEQAGLRALREAYLVHLFREGEMMAAAPETILHADDVLTFVGDASVLDRLLERPGLRRVIAAVDPQEKMTLPLFEAVVAPSSRLVGQTLRQTNFREQFQGVVLGIQRRDAQVEGSLANVPIKPGDLLLVEAPPGFDARWNGQRNDFYLVAPYRPGKASPQENKAPLALAILVAVILFAAIGVAPIVTTSFVGALAMLASRCLQGWEARGVIDMPVLVVIASALGIGRAIDSSGLANAIAMTIIDHAQVFGTLGILVAIYFTTSILTEFVTNNAAAALMLSIGLAAATDLGIDPKAFAIAIAIAASASFLTPIGYQTNLMVMAAGGYRFFDYTRCGIFVNLVVATVAISVIWMFWL